MDFKTELEKGIIQLINDIEEPFATVDLPNDYFLANNTTEDKYIITLIGITDAAAYNYVVDKSTMPDPKMVYEYFLKEMK